VLAPAIAEAVALAISTYIPPLSGGFFPNMHPQGTPPGQDWPGARRFRHRKRNPDWDQRIGGNFQKKAPLSRGSEIP